MFKECKAHPDCSHARRYSCPVRLSSLAILSSLMKLIMTTDNEEARDDDTSKDEDRDPMLCDDNLDAEENELRV